MNSDISELYIRYEKVDSNKPPIDQIIEVNYMTRERSNGNVKRGITNEGKISIDYDTRMPIVVPRETALLEDKWEMLKDSLPLIKPYFSEDKVYVKDIEIPSGLKIKNILTGDELKEGLHENIFVDIEDVNWRISGENNKSGDFQIRYTLEARPGHGSGKVFEMANRNHKISVLGIPDKPNMALKILKLTSRIMDGLI